MKKRIVSLLVVFAMAFAFTVPAFATNHLPEETVLTEKNMSAVLDVAMKRDAIVLPEKEYCISELFHVRLIEGQNITDISDNPAIHLSAEADVASVSGTNVTFYQTGRLNFSYEKDGCTCLLYTSE